MKNDFYTYAWLREDGTPYYIGKGRGDRAYSKSGRSVGMPPKERILLLKTGLTEEEAFKHEIYMIAIFGRKDLGTGILWNFTDGGDGSTGYRHTFETREKMRRTRQNVPREVGEKIRQARLGTKHSPETIEKIRLAKQNMPQATREKMRQSALKRWEKKRTEGG